jgi:hypothetical protein
MEGAAVAVEGRCRNEIGLGPIELTVKETDEVGRNALGLFDDLKSVGGACSG